MPIERSRQALRQGLALLLVIGAGAASVFVAKQRPDGPEELKISMSQLRSQAAEIELLSIEAGSAVPPRVVRAHAMQLARAVERARDELDALRLPPALASLRERSRPSVERMASWLRALQAPQLPSTPALAMAAREARHSLQATEESLP